MELLYSKTSYESDQLQALDISLVEYSLIKQQERKNFNQHSKEELSSVCSSADGPIASSVASF